MVPRTYRVVIEGLGAPNTDTSIVQERLARLFRINSTRVQDLFDGRSHIVKKGLDETTAKRYVDAVRATGANCQLIVDPDSVAMTQKAPHSEPLPPTRPSPEEQPRPMLEECASPVYTSSSGPAKPRLCRSALTAVAIFWRALSPDGKVFVIALLALVAIMVSEVNRLQGNRNRAFRDSPRSSRVTRADQGTPISGSGPTIGCRTRADLGRAFDMANRNDLEALGKLIDNGRCAMLGPDSLQSIEQVSDDYLTARVRPRGETSAFWVPIESTRGVGSR